MKAGDQVHNTQTTHTNDIVGSGNSATTTHAGQAQRGKPLPIIDIPLGKITVGERLRTLDEENVERLVRSIRLEGLHNPITISHLRQLLSGFHRLEAVKRLGWETIPAIIQICEGAEAQLAEIDENLVRRELTVLEEGEHLVLRDQLLREMGQRAVSGGQRKDGGDNMSPPPTTTAEMMQDCGIGERSGQRRMHIARDIDKSARGLIRRLPVANCQSQLEQLARMPEERQIRVAQMLADGRLKRVPTTTNPAAVEQPKRQCSAVKRLDGEVRELFARFDTIVGRLTNAVPKTAAGKFKEVILDLHDMKMRQIDIVAELLGAVAEAEDGGPAA